MIITSLEIISLLRYHLPIRASSILKLFFPLCFIYLHRTDHYWRWYIFVFRLYIYIYSWNNRDCLHKYIYRCNLFNWINIFIIEIYYYNIYNSNILLVSPISIFCARWNLFNHSMNINWVLCGPDTVHRVRNATVDKKQSFFHHEAFLWCWLAALPC